MAAGCKICGSNRVEVIYDDYIRDGAVGRLTDKPYKMYQCLDCGTIWHKLKPNQNKEYYESERYRKELEDSVASEDYYSLHDREVLEKLQYTGTDIYRHKTVVDIGAGGGSFLDFIHAVAKETIAIEPSEIYRMDMVKRGHICFPYAKNAIESGVKADVVVSYDVIEHVDDVVEFMKDVASLLKDGGIGYIGTPTDAPVLRKLLGHTYEQFLFSYQHPWVLSEKAFERISYEAGFKEVTIRQVQRYGLSNTFTWLNEKKPKGHNHISFVPNSLEQHYKHALEELRIADYIISVVKR